MTWKEVINNIITQLIEHVLGNSVILMMLVIGTIMTTSLFVVKAESTIEKIMIAGISAIAGGAGNAVLQRVLPKQNGNGTPPTAAPPVTLPPGEVK